MSRGPATRHSPANFEDIQQWPGRIAALSFSIIALALLTGLVYLFDCRHSAAVFRRLCAEGESFRGSVPIFLISVTHSGLGNDYGQRPGRGIRLERVGMGTANSRRGKTHKIIDAPLSQKMGG